MGRYSDEEGNVFASNPEHPDLTSFLTIGDGRFAATADPEVEYRFFDLKGGRYRTLEFSSPLWPTERFSRF